MSENDSNSKQIAEINRNAIADFESAERFDAVAEITETRKKLGEFSVRDMHEAIFGDDFTEMVLGSEGGTDMLMSEVKHDLTMNDNGEAKIEMDRSQLKTLLIEANPNASEVEIEALMKPDSTKSIGMRESLNNQLDDVNRQHQETIEKYGNDGVVMTVTEKN